MTFCTSHLLFLPFSLDCLTVTLSFSITFADETVLYNHETNETKLEDWPLIRLSVKRKMHVASKLAKIGKGDLEVMDPFKLDDLWFIFNDGRGFLNASLQDVKIHGLSSMILKDIATNSRTKGLSVLLRCPDVLINGRFHINYQTQDSLDENTGKFYVNIKDWYISWFADVVAFHNLTDTLDVKRLTVRSYFDNKTEKFNSFEVKDYSKHYQHTVNMISSMLLDKVQKEVDKKFAQMLGFLVKKRTSNEQPALVTFEKLVSHHGSRQKRQVPCEPGKELDEYVDSLFRFASRIVRAMEPISLPNTTVELPEYNLKLFLYNGQASKAYTLTRKKSAWVYCGNESVSLGLTIGFENLRVKYSYRAIMDWTLLFDGELETDLKGTIIQVQFTQTTPEDEDEDVQQRVDRLKIWKVGEARVLVKGLGNLTQALSMILTSTINQNQEQLMPTLRKLEQEGVTLINRQIMNISIPFFSII